MVVHINMTKLICNSNFMWHLDINVHTNIQFNFLNKCCGISQLSVRNFCLANEYIEKKRNEHFPSCSEKYGSLLRILYLRAIAIKGHTLTLSLNSLTLTKYQNMPLWLDQFHLHTPPPPPPLHTQPLWRVMSAWLLGQCNIVGWKILSRS